MLRITSYYDAMIMLSFRASVDDVARATAWAQRLGVDRSELLRDALHAHLARLGSEQDAEIWEREPPTDEEVSLGAIAEWDLPTTGPTGPVRRGEIWFAAVPGGDRPVLVLTRDPVADRIASVVVCALTRTRRGLVSELDLTPEVDGVPTACVANFDTLHTIPQSSLRRRVAALSPARMAQACRALRDATGC